MAISDYVVTDDLTVLLGLISVTVFLLNSLYKPQPLVHPILLGRQSDAGRVRHARESAVYRNYGTGLMGRFPMRPDKNCHLVSDLVKADFDPPRTLWSTKITNAQLKERIASFGTGLIRLAGLVPRESNVLLVLNDSIEFLITDLALSSHSIPSFAITSQKLLSPVLESHPPSAIVVDGSFLPNVLELIYDAHEKNHVVIVVGKYDQKALPNAIKDHVRVLDWADIEAEGAKGDKVLTDAPLPSDIFTASFYAIEGDELQGVQFSHDNITAGVTATRALLPLSNVITSLDTIASAHSLSTPIGRVIAYTALFEGTSLTTLPSSKVFRVDETAKPDVTDVTSFSSSISSPTILFLQPSHVQNIVTAILSHAKKSTFTYSFAWRHKLAGLSDGFITKDSLWDRLVFDGAREKVLGEMAGTLRAVIVTGGPLESALLTPARIAFSVPLINMHSHPAVAGPVFASQPLDLQAFSVSANASTSDPFATVAHVGAPSVNVEVKLTGVQDDDVEAGGDPVGMILLRGPSVGTTLGANVEEGVEERNWVITGQLGKVATNGSFKILSVKQ